MPLHSNGASPENLQTEVAFLFEEKFDLGFDAHALGMFQGELDALINVPPIKSKASPEPSIRIPSGPAVTRLHDVWTIGSHVIGCADSSGDLAYERVLDTERADMVLSDQPYNVKVNGHIGGKGGIKHREFVQGSGEMSRDEFNDFTRKTLTLQAAYSRPGAIVMQFADWRMTSDMMRIAEDIFDPLLNICVWVKPLPAMGSLYRSQHEFVLVLRVPGGKHLNNVQLGRMGRNRSNVWEYASPAGFGTERKNLALHPTCKNIEMLADAIMDVTNHNDIVLDAFLGSGSTALACHKVGRRCRGIELDPLFVDLAVLRLGEATGATPVNQDGMTFEEARAERAEDASR